LVLSLSIYVFFFVFLAKLFCSNKCPPQSIILLQHSEGEESTESEEMSEPSKRTSGPVQRYEEMSEPSKPTSGPGQRYGISSFANLPQPRGTTKNNLVLKSLFSSSSILPGKK
jgi:hypothetical protein